MEEVTWGAREPERGEEPDLLFLQQLAVGALALGDGVHPFEGSTPITQAPQHHYLGTSPQHMNTLGINHGRVTVRRGHSEGVEGPQGSTVTVTHFGRWVVKTEERAQGRGRSRWGRGVRGFNRQWHNPAETGAGRARGRRDGSSCHGL